MCVESRLHQRVLLLVLISITCQQPISEGLAAHGRVARSVAYSLAAKLPGTQVTRTRTALPRLRFMAWYSSLSAPF
jgi:hypothetical protein